ncbi:MAG: threonine synthase [Bdellovibrionota bacterium]
MTSVEMEKEFLACLDCKQKYAINDERYFCDCGANLSVERPIEVLKKLCPKTFDERLKNRDTINRSGVWRFREAIRNLPLDQYISHPEGGNFLYTRVKIDNFANSQQIFLKHEGENPTGSFKDRGMTVAITQAKLLGKRVAACASTGNTSASLAAYAAQAKMKALVFVPAGKISKDKLAQALAYGATCIALKGNFDDAMHIVKKVSEKSEIYMVNSLNPFRHEGQKSIVWEIFQDLNWQAPDWIVVPGGNLGNTSAFGKAIHEAYEAGWITKKPRLATIQAEGANPFFLSFQNQFRTFSSVNAETIATAIRIGNPVNIKKAIHAIQLTHGIVEQVNDEEIIEAKCLIDAEGIGCEPASACSLAGIKKLITKNVIKSSEKVVGVLTGNLLKDTNSILQDPSKQSTSGKVLESEASIKAIEKIIENI